LLEVDRWTNFTRHFTHLKSAEPAADRSLLLTAILADAFNLGLEKMAEACPGTSLGKLAWNALARTVFFHRLGEIRDRSYENQRYRASGLNLVIAAITLWNTVYLEGRHIGRKPLELDTPAILSDRARGQSLAQLAKGYRVSRSTIHRLLQDHDQQKTA
jgi:Mor family transcriptional regulator